MNNKYILSVLAGGLLFAACSKEDPFHGGDKEDGRISKTALLLSVKDDVLATTRADEADVNLDEFNVLFFKEGNSQPAAKYKFGEMPDVVTLPVGSYTCTATYGEDRQAEWESPYFLGTSDAFEVNAYEITSEISPIVCALENIKVTINFDASLRSAMSDDSYVEVKVGDSSSLKYGIAEADAKKAGYFKHGEEISLVAVFHGAVNGEETVETKSLANVAKGCHYNITFRLHTGGGADATGDADANVNVDATVSVTDVVRDVELPDDELLDDNERPKENGGDDPEPPVPGGDAPTIELNGGDISDNPYQGSSMSTCVLTMKSVAEGGFTTFICNIKSEKLEPELPGMGLPTHIDLAHPDRMEIPDGYTVDDVLGILNNFQFPTDVLGKKEATIDLSNFIGLMGALGEGQHAFELIVGDANGETVKTLTLNF